MAYTSLDNARITRTATVEAAVGEVTRSMSVIDASRVAVAAQGGEGLPSARVTYDANNEPIMPTVYWQVGDIPGSAPIRPGGS